MSILKQHLTTLTIFGLVCGIVVGIVLQGQLRSPRKLDEDEFIREVERGSRMAVIIRAENLAGLVADRGRLGALSEEDGPLVVRNATVIVPDADAAPILGCKEDGDTYFSGEITRKSEVYRPEQPNMPARDDGHISASIRAVGTVTVCKVGKEGGLGKSIAARGLSVAIPTHNDSGNECRFFTVSAISTYFDFFGNLFVTFLLMLFIPTLALALLRAVLDAAGRVREFSSAFLFFVISSICASAIGVFGGVGLSYLRHDLDKEQLQTLARAFGGRPEDVAYDPHPLLTQLGKVVPTNPLGALSDPNGNSGLQIAFIAVVIGGVLVGYRQASRQAISASLKKTLSVFVKDNQSGDTAISDYADWAAPIGVFCLGAATLSKMDTGALQEMASLVLTSVACLAIFVVLLLIWIRFRRNWKDWFNGGLKHSGGALATAFGTSSSYSALPKLSALPLAADNSVKRGVLDFGITLNKSGTAVYIGAAAGFMLARFATLAPSILLSAILLCALASMACAGLPFAAVFALRMVLGASGVVPGGVAWLILPIDPILDRFVTVVNVFANICACSDGRSRPKASLAYSIGVENLSVGAAGGPIGPNGQSKSTGEAEGWPLPAGVSLD
jgi:DAACS family dicarboxylate/amino acid:cation (Na+ or H+) symporter